MSGSKIDLFFIKANRMNHVGGLDANHRLVLENAPDDVAFDRNEDGSIAIKFGGEYLSAQSETDGFDLRQSNSDSDKIFLEEAVFVYSDLSGLDGFAANK